MTGPGGIVEAMAARRDAAAYNSPGYSRRYHVVGQELRSSFSVTMLGACAGQLLVEETAIPVAEVALVLRCQRSGCRGRWP